MTACTGRCISVRGHSYSKKQTEKMCFCFGPEVHAWKCNSPSSTAVKPWQQALSVANSTATHNHSFKYLSTDVYCHHKVKEHLLSQQDLQTAHFHLQLFHTRIQQQKTTWNWCQKFPKTNAVQSHRLYLRTVRERSLFQRWVNVKEDFNILSIQWHAIVDMILTW